MIKHQSRTFVATGDVYELAEVHANGFVVLVTEVDKIFLAKPSPDALPGPTRVDSERIQDHHHGRVSTVGQLLLGQKLVTEAEVGLHGSAVHGLLEHLPSCSS